MHLLLREVAELDAVADLEVAGHDSLQERRLPAAVRPDEGDVLAALEGERDVVEELPIARPHVRMYVEELIGPNTVNTMPEETIQAFQDHGKVALTLEQGLDEAKQLFADLEQAGIDYDDVTVTLEKEGVEKFADSFSELLEGIRAKSGELVTA